MDNLAGVQVFGVTPEQATEIVSRLSTKGVGPVNVIDTQPACIVDTTSNVCITGRCDPYGGTCFADAARSVLYPDPAVIRFHIQHCQYGHCKREY